MSRGHHQHPPRHAGLNQFGKELTRRSGARCELCETAGVKLVPYEVPPIPPEPDLEHCLFVCETCLTQIEHPAKRDPSYWHFLGRTVWSPIPVVQVLSVYLLHSLADDALWARELLDELYLSPEVARWVEQIEY